MVSPEFCDYQIRCQLAYQIRCQLAKSGVSLAKSGSEIRCQRNPVSVHHSCPKRRTDTGFPRISDFPDFPREKTN